MAERKSEGGGSGRRRKRTNERGKGRGDSREGNRGAGSKGEAKSTASPDATKRTDEKRKAGGTGGTGDGRKPERVDSGELGEKAWQLFTIEMAEEGVRMLDKSDAEDLAELCFDKVEGFLKVKRRRTR